MAATSSGKGGTTGTTNIGMDVYEAARTYVSNKCIESVPGIKALLLDDDTSPSVGLVMSHTKALNLQVYAIDRLDNPMRKPVGQIRAVCIVRPTPENIKVFRRELSQPRFEEYHIFFTNTLPDHLLKDLAQADVGQVVKQVQEIYLDYYPLGSDLFSLNIASCMGLQQPRWDQGIFDRVCDGLTSVLLALKRLPVIAFQKNSPIAEKVAEEIEARISSGNHSSDVDLFRFSGQSKMPAFLLILDRRDDPVTPLLNQWTYCSMIHEHLTIRNNRVDLSNTPSGKDVGGEVTLNCLEDEFYRSAQYLIFGELGEAIKKAAEEFQNSEVGMLSGEGGRAKLQSLKDIQRLIDRFPELQRQRSAFAKHVALTTELSRIIDERKLMDISEVEQELACTENLTEAFNRVETMIEDPKVTELDKLRMVLLYSLRYELEGEREIRFLERSLRDAGVAPHRLSAIQALRKYAGVNVRGPDIFHKHTVVGAARTMMRKHVEGIRGVENALTRHEPLLSSRLTALKMAGLSCLRDSEFKILGAGKSCPRPQEIIIFVIGGTTYAEAKCVYEFNRDNAGKGLRVVLGGTTIHSTATFIDDVVKFDPSTS